MIIYLDLDGVMADLHLAFQKKKRKRVVKYLPGVWDLSYIYGSEFSDDLAGLSQGFWENLPRTQHFSSMMEMLDTIMREEPYVKLVIASSPCSSACAAGKIVWCNTHLPGIPVILIKEKDLLRSYGAVLIDDGEHNVDAWNLYDGPESGILFPADWNRKHAAASDPVTHVEQQLRALL